MRQLLQQRVQMKKALRIALDVLAKIEWKGGVCPRCDFPERDGHRPGCEIESAFKHGSKWIVYEVAA